MRPSLLCPASLLTLLLIGGLPARADAPAEAERAILDLYKSNKLFDKTQYRAVRAAFARLFEQEHAEEIRRAFGSDHEKLSAWLDARPALKEKFYTALDERHDRVGRALELFKDVWKRSPERAEKYADLAVAVAVTWDDERGVYDYRRHQRRTRSKLPADEVDALGNFDYAVENEKAMEGRLQLLPWELLVFVIDHRTPVAERKWAQGYYRSARGRIRSWHQDVPYDHDMLKGEMNRGSGLRPHLEGKDYTLANIKKCGGVCAMQADFAARVAKSAGIPAFWCYGQSAHRGWHAWWMYVQVQKGGKQLRFTLQSDGRFEGKDLFYTGRVVDPQTGQEVLDRDMERRLSVVGRDPNGKRQADLIMRAYPRLCERLSLDPRARVAYLDRCLQVSAYNEAAWLEFARLVKAGELAAGQKQTVLNHLSSMFHTFAKYPDFVRRALDDLASVAPSVQERVRLYDQAVNLFERAGRADLACDARMKIAEYWVEQKQWQRAAQGLIATVKRFPTEGRYVPRMTEKLQEICKNYKGGDARLAQLYLELVPAMVSYYRGEDDYARKMYDQAARYFAGNGMDKNATRLKARVEQARALPGRGR